MAHDHSHVRLGRRLLIGPVINAVMLALQVVGGISANSLGLLSDAAHNGSGVAALGTAYAAGARYARSEASAAGRRVTT